MEGDIIAVLSYPLDFCCGVRCQIRSHKSYSVSAGESRMGGSRVSERCAGSCSFVSCSYPVTCCKIVEALGNFAGEIRGLREQTDCALIPSIDVVRCSVFDQSVADVSALKSALRATVGEIRDGEGGVTKRGN